MPGTHGGRWEIVNRFHCQPRWSNMTGESADGLAALWTKYRYGGNFCVELYAGMRHGSAWYARCGDMNLTVMNQRTTPSEGYTAISTGWDVDESQLVTRLLRNGEPLAFSDKYLAPRRREGNVRRGYNPLVAGGRPVHGAWYYIRFRRIGNTLQYFFDNEPVFEVEDEDPIGEGSMGIWTFLNSMVVARVKIAAESVRPQPVDVAPLELQAAWQTAAPSLPAACRNPPGLELNGQPAFAMQPDLWNLEAETAQGTLAWSEHPPQNPCFVVTSVLGSGRLFCRSALPPVPYPDLAGWTFRIKRTPLALLNFHFTVGRMRDGQYTVERRFFHRISGTDFSEGDFHPAGSTDVAAAAAAGRDDWHTDGEWTPVTVWIPAAGFLANHAADSNLLVRAEGFGILQPSDEMQGLTGNGPGESYAVSGFSEIRRHRPRLAASAENAPHLFDLLCPADGTVTATVSNVADLAAWTESAHPAAWVRADLRVHAQGSTALAPLSWVAAAAQPRLAAAWNPAIPHTVDITSTESYPVRRLAAAEVDVAGTPGTELPGGFNRRSLLLPHELSVTSAVPVTLRSGTNHWTFHLDAETPTNAAPLLASLDGLTPFFVNFEERRLAAPLQPTASRNRLIHADPLQGSYLEVFNDGRAQRLRCDFAVQLDLARYPVFAFRYKGVGMANVSLSLQNRFHARISEPRGPARSVRHAPDVALDGSWQSWAGLVSDAVTSHPLSPELLAVRTLHIASLDGADQTGLHSRWGLDDLVFGPAVRSGEQLAFTPLYVDPNGVERVQLAVLQGPSPYDALAPEQRDALAWQDIPNAQAAAPDLAGLPQGLSFLLLRAANTHGLWSSVTQVPFLLDTEPARVSQAFKSSADPVLNGTFLEVTVQTAGGAPLDLEQLRLRWNDEEASLLPLGSTLVHGADKQILNLNWPYLFRSQLDRTSDGDQANLVLGNLRDGAGNPTADVSVPIRIDHASDETAPTLLRTDYPTNVLWTTRWETPPFNTVHFSAPQGHPVRLQHGDGAPYLEFQTVNDKAHIWMDVKHLKWTLDAHPYLAFRIRRPLYAPDESTEIALHLEFDDKTRLPIVIEGRRRSRRRRPDYPVSWESNVWHAVTLDLPAILGPQLSAEQLQNAQVQVLRLRVQQAPKDYPLHLQSVFVFAGWNEADTVRVNAYDASGMGGVTWEYEADATGMEIAPAFPFEAGIRNGWIAMFARDRAGNLTYPVHIPIQRLDSAGR